MQIKKASVVPKHGNFQKFIKNILIHFICINAKNLLNFI